MEVLSNALPAVGSFHPLVLHLPIGLLVGVVALELWMVAHPAAPLRPTIAFLLLLTGAGMLVSAATGLSLAQGGGYDEDLVAWHRNLGLLAALCAIVAFLVHRYVRGHAGARPTLIAYRLALSLGFGAMLGAGHYGSIITHGDKTPFATLATLLRNGAEAGVATAPPSDSSEFAAQPILAQHCYECHGAEKQKNNLRLDLRDTALKGGKSGKPAIVPGNAMASLLVEAIVLPADHKRAMPPSGKPRLEPREVLTLIEWINRGARWPDAYQRHPEGVVQPSDQALIDLRRQGVHVSRLAIGHPLLRIDQIPAGMRLEALRPVVANIAWLDLADFAFEPEELRILVEMPHLTRLELQRSNLADADLAYVAALPNVAFLNLYGTDIGDAGIERLVDRQSLEHLYLWGTRVSAAAIERLRAALPKTLIEAGGAPATS